MKIMRDMDIVKSHHDNIIMRDMVIVKSHHDNNERHGYCKISS